MRKSETTCFPAERIKRKVYEDLRFQTTVRFLEAEGKQDTFLVVFSPFLNREDWKCGGRICTNACWESSNVLSLVGWPDLLKMSFTTSSISGDDEEMSFYEQTIHSLEKEIYRCSDGVFIPSLAFSTSASCRSHTCSLHRHHNMIEAFKQSEQFSHCSFSAFLPLLQTTTFKINCISPLSKVSMNTGNCAQNHQTQNRTVSEITSCSWARD